MGDKLPKILGNTPATDPEQFFRIDHLTDLKGRSVRGGAVTMVTQACKFGLSLGSNVLLARLLTPHDYGLIGMVTAVIGLVALFKDMGLSIATVQKAEINHKQVSTLFWVNVAASVAIMLLTMALAPAIAWLYREPRLVGITLVLASAFIFGGLTVQHQALLNRQMRFTALAFIDITSVALGVAAAVVMAWCGFGYWALVSMQVVTAIANAICVWRICGWRPGPPVKDSGVRSLLAFGGNLTGFSFVNYFARNLDNVLIGWCWGAQQLGLYAKAYQLLLLPIQQMNAPIAAVAIPSLSRLQNDPQQFRHYYLKALALLTFFATPVAILLIVLSEEIIELFLGSQWREAGIIFRLLGISALVQPICNTTGWLYLSTGRTDRMFCWGLYASTLIEMSFFIGLPYGGRGVAFCYAIAMLLLTGPCLYYATRGISITMLDLLHAVKHTFLASLLAGVAAFGVKIVAVASSVPVWATATICSLVLTSLYLIIMFYLFNKKAFYLSVLHEFKRR